MKGWKFYYKNLGHWLEDHFRKYRSYLKPICYKRYRSMTVKSGFDQEPVSLIDLEKTEILTDAGRYFFALVNGLVDAGHHVYVIKKLWLVNELAKKKYSAMLIDNEKFHFIEKCQVIENDVPIDILWVDSENHLCKQSLMSRLARKTVVMRRSPKPIKNRMWIPYQVHPETLMQPVLGDVRLAEARKFGVFFIGNVVPAYDSDFVRTHHVMTRIHVLETLIDLAPNTIQYERFDGIGERAEHERKSVFLPMYDREIRQSSGRVPAENYTAILNEIDFVVCAPGTYMPFAHNVIEAMSHGCIPIIQYGHYFSPELEDGVNCLIFYDAESLITAVKRAISMDFEDRKRMRKAAWDYHHEHLNFAGLIEKLERLDSPVKAFYYA